MRACFPAPPFPKLVRLCRATRFAGGPEGPGDAKKMIHKPNPRKSPSIPGSFSFKCKKMAGISHALLRARCPTTSRAFVAFG